MKDVDWFSGLPKQARSELIKKRAHIPEEERRVLQRYGKEYFDVATPYSYGGYHYDGRFEGVVSRIIEHYGLGPDSSVLDVGCAKGFLLYEFYRKGIRKTYGVDISDYAIANAPAELRDQCFVGSADDLSRFADGQFDLVLSKDALHNLPPEGADRALREIVRVGKGPGFLQINSYNTEHQRKCLLTWVITIKAVRSTSEWLEAFKRAGYTGDYHFLIHDYELPSEPVG